MRHIRLLAEEDETHDLKLAPHLKAGYLNYNNLDKVSVSSAVAVHNQCGGSQAAACKDGILPLVYTRPATPAQK